jgi:hypothetical protein
LTCVCRRGGPLFLFLFPICICVCICICIFLIFILFYFRLLISRISRWLSFASPPPKRLIRFHNPPPTTNPVHPPYLFPRQWLHLPFVNDLRFVLVVYPQANRLCQTIAACGPTSYHLGRFSFPRDLLLFLWSLGPRYSSAVRIVG